MMYLKQSTASQSVMIGPFIDSTDGNTAETGLTVSAADIRLSKNGANIVGKNSGDGTHDELGYYTITLDATDTNTVGRLQLMVHESGALPVYHEYWVLEEAVYDAIFGASAAGYGTAQTGDSYARLGAPAGASVSADIAAVKVDTAAILVDTGTTLDGRIPAALVGGRMDSNVGAISSDATAADNAEAFFDGTGYAGTGNVIPTVTTLTGHTAQTGDCYARLGAPAGASVSADVAAVKADTAAILVDTGTTLDAKIDAIDDLLDTEVAAIKSDTAAILIDTAEIGAAGAGLTAVPWNAAWDAEVQSEATDALNAYDPPTKAELDAAVANVSVDEIQATALADLFNTDSGTTYGSAVPGSVVAEIADNAGGSALTTDAIAEAMFTYNATATYATADAGSVVKQIADNAGGSSLTVGDIADAVWDEAQAGHVGAGTFGEVATEIAAILVDTAEIGAAGAGLTVLATQASVNTIDDFLDTEVAAILADTNELQTDWANGGRLDLILDARASQTSVDDVPTNAELATALGTADDAILAVLGAPAGASMSADIAAVKSDTAAILTDTGTTLDGKIDTIDTVVDAIKVKTDSLTFTTAGMVDSAVKRVGDTTLAAAGTGGQGYGA